ncbi:MAG TPA: Hpt domain-containing protein, partial [Polyangiaceae bacterium]
MTAPELRDFIAAYLVEAEEHLAAASSQLLAIESAQQNGETNPRAVRETFRSLHTIKGLSAMVGVEPIVTIAHRMETFLREADRSSTALPMKAIDALLHGVRAIEQRIVALGRGDAVSAPSEELMARLDSLGLSPAPVVPATPLLELEAALLEKLAPFERDQLTRAIAGGERAVRADFYPSPERAAEGLSINSLRERLGTVAEIVRVLPRAVPVSANAPGGLAFVVLLHTRRTNEDLARASGLRLDAFGSLTRELAEPESTGLEATEPALELSAPAREEEGFDSHARRGIVRVDVTRLDAAMDGLSSLIVTRFRLAHAAAALSERGVNTRELSQIIADS